MSTDMLLFSTNRPVTPSPRLPFPVLLLPLLRLALPPVSALASTPSSSLVVLLASLPTSTSRPSRAPLAPALKRIHRKSSGCLLTYRLSNHAVGGTEGPKRRDTFSVADSGERIRKPCPNTRGHQESTGSISMTFHDQESATPQQRSLRNYCSK